MAFAVLVVMAACTHDPCSRGIHWGGRGRRVEGRSGAGLPPEREAPALCVPTAEGVLIGPAVQVRFVVFATAFPGSKTGPGVF